MSLQTANQLLVKRDTPVSERAVPKSTEEGSTAHQLLVEGTYNTETEVVALVRRVEAEAERRANDPRDVEPAATTSDAEGTSRISNRIFY